MKATKECVRYNLSATIKKNKNHLMFPPILMNKKCLIITLEGRREELCTRMTKMTLLYRMLKSHQHKEFKNSIRASSKCKREGTEEGEDKYLLMMRFMSITKTTNKEPINSVLVV